MIHNSSYNNGGDRVQVLAGSMVSGNALRSNAGFGLNPNGTSGYAGNVMTGNLSGTVNGAVSLNEIGTNFCESNATCP
ncbi:MAG: hypothetical protein ACE5IL_14285 [Myxococcota bacterium]